MEHALQVQLAREIFDYVDAGSTCLADRGGTNPGGNDTDPDLRMQALRTLVEHDYPRGTAIAIV